MNLNKEIQEAAELLKEEEILLGDTSAITSVIEDWLVEQLEEIVWNYRNSPSLQREIFKVELAQERREIAA